MNAPRGALAQSAEPAASKRRTVGRSADGTESRSRSENLLAGVIDVRDTPAFNPGGHSRLLVGDLQRRRLCASVDQGPCPRTAATSSAACSGSKGSLVISRR
jgi:hypothetical protein